MAVDDGGGDDVRIGRIGASNGDVHSFKAYVAIAAAGVIARH